MFIFVTPLVRIKLYFVFSHTLILSATCQGIWSEAVDHLTIAMPLTLNSAIELIFVL
jgi:hypothetical protein